MSRIRRGNVRDIATLPQPTATQPTTPVPPGDAAAGKAVFTANCGGCHTLSDAGTTGAVGPNLDQTKPILATVVDRVVNGKGTMPPFKGRLKDVQIADVAAYVVKATAG